MNLATTDDLHNTILTLCRELDEACTDLKTLAIDEAKLETSYRKAKAIAYLSASGPVKERESHVDRVCDNDRERYYLARAAKEAQLELVRSIRQKLSAIQTIGAGLRSEAELARFDKRSA